MGDVETRKVVEDSKKIAMTEMVLKPFVVSDKPLDLCQLLGLTSLDSLSMSIDKYNPNVLDFSFQRPNDEATLIQISAIIDEAYSMNASHQWISVEFVHKFEDDSNVGFRLYYQPDDMTHAPDNFTLKNLQILPRQGETSFPRNSHLDTDEAIVPNVDLFPGEESMICIEDILPDMTHGELPKDFPYSLIYSHSVPDTVSLIAVHNEKYCHSPFNITLPARIGFSKEQFKEALQEVKKIK
jgi:hypothetical protein